MRPFKTSMFGTYDLDDTATYKHLPDTRDELRDRIFRKIGYAHCYMDFWHPEIYVNKASDGGQRLRIKKLIKEFTDNETDNYENIMWYKEQLFILEDETENMC